MILVALVLVAYFLGAVPFGVLVAHAKGVDLTRVGSGNIGATNVIRALGAKWGIFVFVLDMLKGLVPALLGRVFVTAPVGPADPQTVWFLLGIVAVVGHAKSPFLGFKGGKGVSTALGAGLGAAPLVALASFALFGVVLAVTRYMSIASVVGVCAPAFFDLVIPGQSHRLFPLFLLLGITVAILHRKNFRRLREGTEPKFRFKREVPSSDRPAAGGPGKPPEHLEDT